MKPSKRNAARKRLINEKYREGKPKVSKYAAKKRAEYEGPMAEALKVLAVADAATLAAGMAEAMGGPIATDAEIARTADHRGYVDGAS